MIFGNRWRTLAWNRKTGERIEQRSSEDGEEEFDELVIGYGSDVWFHLEQMNVNDWWFAFYIDNERSVCGNMHVTNRGREFSVWCEGEDEPEDTWRRGTPRVL